MLFVLAAAAAAEVDDAAGAAVELALVTDADVVTAANSSAVTLKHGMLSVNVLAATKVYKHVRNQFRDVLTKEKSHNICTSKERIVLPIVKGGVLKLDCCVGAFCNVNRKGWKLVALMAGVNFRDWSYHRIELALQSRI